MSYWTEDPREEGEFIWVTVGSLRGSDLRDLEDLGFLPEEGVDEAQGKGLMTEGSEEGKVGLPWFETLVEGSRLGRMRKSWGSREGRNGRFKIEWEIVEWTEDEGNNGAAGKRKLGELVEDEAMEGVH